MGQDALRTLRADVLEHADHEEREEHPRLRNALSEERRQVMGESWLELKKTAPTRPPPTRPRPRRSVRPWARSPVPSTARETRPATSPRAEWPPSIVGRDANAPRPASSPGAPP